MKQPLGLLQGSPNSAYLVPFLHVLTVLEGLAEQLDKTYKVLRKPPTWQCACSSIPLQS